MARNKILQHSNMGELRCCTHICRPLRGDCPLHGITLLRKGSPNEGTIGPGLTRHFPSLSVMDKESAILAFHGDSRCAVRHDLRYHNTRSETSDEKDTSPTPLSFSHGMVKRVIYRRSTCQIEDREILNWYKIRLCRLPLALLHLLLLGC